MPNWPEHVTGDEMVAAMDKLGIDGAIFISPFAMYRYDASYAVEVQRAHPGSVRDRQTGGSGRPGGGGSHRRLEEDAGHGRHSHHAAERIANTNRATPVSTAFCARLSGTTFR